MYSRNDIIAARREQKYKRDVLHELGVNAGRASDSLQQMLDEFVKVNGTGNSAIAVAAHMRQHLDSRHLVPESLTRPGAAMSVQQSNQELMKRKMAGSLSTKLDSSIANVGSPQKIVMQHGIAQTVVDEYARRLCGMGGLARGREWREGERREEERGEERGERTGEERGERRGERRRENKSPPPSPSTTRPRPHQKVMMKASQALAEREEKLAKEQLRRSKKAKLDAIQAQIEARKSRVFVRQRELEEDRRRVEHDLARFRKEDDAKARIKRAKILKDKAELEADRKLTKEIAEREKAKALAEDRGRIEREHEEVRAAARLAHEQKLMLKRIAEQVKIENIANRAVKDRQKAQQEAHDMRLLKEYEERLMKEDRLRKMNLESKKRAIISNETRAQEIIAEEARREQEINDRIARHADEADRMREEKAREKERIHKLRVQEQLRTLDQQIQLRKERAARLKIEDQRQADIFQRNIQIEEQKEIRKQMALEQRRAQYREELLQQQKKDVERKRRTAGAMSEEERKMNASYLMLYNQMHGAAGTPRQHQQRAGPGGFGQGLAQGQGQGQGHGQGRGQGAAAVPRLRMGAVARASLQSPY